MNRELKRPCSSVNQLSRGAHRFSEKKFRVGNQRVHAVAETNSSVSENGAAW